MDSRQNGLPRPSFFLDWASPDKIQGIEMYQHADHRPPLALARLLTARGFLLDHPGFLQH
jgi:hypothetical protein